jgi:hypothetical protein
VNTAGGVFVVSLRNFLIATALCVVMIPLDTGTASAAQSSSAAREGQRDFDWEIGTWTTRVRVLRNPLSGNPPEWAEYEGTSVVKPVMDGRWNLVELSVAGVTGNI